MTNIVPMALKAAPAVKRITKRDQLIKALRRKSGADIASLSKTFGWQPHSTRAALTGLRKAGYLIENTAAEGKRKAVYRIVDDVVAKPDLADAAKCARYGPRLRSLRFSISTAQT